jgi:hypothetical protein
MAMSRKKFSNASDVRSTDNTQDLTLSHYGPPKASTPGNTTRTANSGTSPSNSFMEVEKVKPVPAQRLANLKINSQSVSLVGELNVF